MAEPRKRIDGWKSIAAHFNRNRTTVIRWATEDGLPVQRVSGKAGASVWAWADELDAWLDDRATFRPVEPAAEPAVVLENPSVRPEPPHLEPSHLEPPHLEPAKADPLKSPAFDSRRRAASSAFSKRAHVPVRLLGVALVFLGVGVVVLRLPERSRAAAPTLPAETFVAETYLKARDEWATRTPEGLNRALSDFSTVIMREPGFAPAYTGLADTYIVAREYTPMTDAVAYPKAEAAARAALAIDPNCASARRALGFVAYWYHQDFPTSQRLFQEALQTAPNDAQTHFWFGNVLFDDGRIEDGLRELRQARLLDPGSRAIETVYAWFQWLQGPDDAGVHDLEEVSQQAPNHSEALRDLAYISLTRGDYRRYLADMARYAALQGKRLLQSEVAAEAEAFRRGGEGALLTVLAQQSWATENPDWIGQWHATAISLLGSRSEFLSRLRSGRGPRLWRGWRWSQARLARWRNDKEVAAAFQAAASQARPS